MILGLAPMDGFTDCTTRLITQNIFEQYGNSTDHQLYLRTEFMTADGYIANPIGVIQHLMTTTNQSNVIAQIHGGNPNTLTQTVIDINNKYSKYFKGIELNLGCPASNIIKSGGGSALLQDKKSTLHLIKSLSQNSKLPFSIKTRTGLNQEDKTNQTDFILQASQYCDMITIHGRTVKQAYSGEADRDFIYNIKNQISNSCKIIGNGGVISLQDAINKSQNLDGIMIGQSAIGNPRIFTDHIPSHQEKFETIIRHLNLMLACEIYFQSNSDQSIKNNKLTMPTIKDLDNIISNFETNKKLYHPTYRSLAEFRKHLFQYIKSIANSREFKVQISQITNYKEIINHIKSFFETNTN